MGDPTYGAIEGPVIGGFGTVYAALIGAIYLDELVYVGIPFYFILILYMWFKNREGRHRAAIRQGAKAFMAAKGAAGAAAPPTAPSGEGAGTPPADAASPPAKANAPSAGEAACPSCGAVVYPNEAKCWKCGASLGTVSAPLKSGADGTPPPPPEP